MHLTRSVHNNKTDNPSSDCVKIPQELFEMALNICLHCSNLLTIIAIVLMSSHHGTVDAESNSTLDETNANATHFMVNTTKEQKTPAITAPSSLHMGRIGDEKSSNSSIPTNNNSSTNGTNNCTTNFGYNNSSTRIVREGRGRLKRGVDMSTNEEVSVENGAEDKSQRSSGSSSSSAEGNDASGAVSGELGQKLNVSSTNVEAINEEHSKNPTEMTNCGDGELLLKLADNEGEDSEEFVQSVKNGSDKVQNGTNWSIKGNASEITINYGKSARNGTMAVEMDNTTKSETSGKEMNGRQKRDSQDFVSQANAQLQSAFGSAQSVLQQQQPSALQQLPTQIIQIPSVDLSSGKAQNILLISDSGNVSMSRGSHFLTVSTVMEQKK
uniref:Serine/threonine-protein kinase DDB_G0282963 n=1 Tax=Globodera pallida TaxID=36090 RepID=A0A183CP75_GLOPA